MSQGRKAKLYYNTGTHASPTWVEMPRVINASVSLSKGEVENIYRGSNWKKLLAGLKEGSLKIDYNLKNGADTVLTALTNSFFNDTDFELAVMDQAISNSGARGFRAYMQVFSDENAQEIEGKQTKAFELKLSEHEENSAVIEPDLYVVS